MIFDDDNNEIFFFVEVIFRIDMKILSKTLQTKNASTNVENTSSLLTK
jgi:hypothetical protein